MNNLITPEHRTKNDKERIIGSLEGTQEGPLVIFLAGMHGNESAGIDAVEQVLHLLRGRTHQLAGKVLAVRANLRALKRNVRYIDEDMNRIWFPSIIEQLRASSERDIESSERLEIKRLLRILDRIEAHSDQPVILADIHTFSAQGSMFTLPNRDDRQIELLSKIYAPMVLGVGESLRGTALKYYSNKGMLSFALEGGQHQNRLTEYNITASLMILLSAAGCIRDDDFSKMDEFQTHLASQTQRLPVKTELVYQHIIEDGDDFEMKPGFKNFQPIKKGEWLASDQNGKIVAQCDGYVLMPLYQNQGNDGFFIIQELEE